MKTTYLALAAALLATGGAASAQSATDARCLILSNAFAQQAKEADAQKMAQASLYFYLGRVGSQSAPQLKTLLEAQAKTITDANAGNLMNDCVKDVRTKMELMQSLNGPAPAQSTKKPEGR
jgi:hypothetical protein